MRRIIGVVPALALSACTIGKDGKQGEPGVPCAGCVDSASLAAGAVTSSALASGAVTSSALAPGAISASALQTGSIGTSALAAKSVTTSIIADGAVTATQLAPGAVTATQLAPGAVTAASFAQGTFSAGPGLVVSGTQYSASLLAPGGRNGTATTVARSDHTHQIIIPVGINDFGLQSGTAAQTKVEFVGATGATPVVPGWTIPQASGGSCISATSVIPPGITAPPTIVLGVHAAAAGVAGINVQSTGVVANGPSPGCVTAEHVQNLTFAAASTLQRMSLPLSTLSVCGSTPAAVAGPGDVLVFRVCNFGGTSVIDYTLTSVQLVWN
jgi:hypothetical protein